AVDGADLVDIGGESTRPGAQPVTEGEELARVIPLAATLAREGVAVSVDTRKPSVMLAAIAAGAAMINDVTALSAQGAIEACAESDVGVCLMHMQGEPETMQIEPKYDDVAAEVKSFLLARVRACLDPGFGFGKTLAHNLALLRALPELAQSGYAVMVGVSRKGMLGQLTGRSVEDRTPASVAGALAAVARGAAIVRVHDVRATIDALKVWQAVQTDNA